MQGAAPGDSVPRPAATVMVVRDARPGIEVYMARRSAHSAFMPDAYVFPGGAVEESDGTQRTLARLHAPPPGIEPAFAVAALRELFEEAGMLFARRADGTPPRRDEAERARRSLTSGADFTRLLERRGWRLDGSGLVFYSRWITPPIDIARRFDARFFLARSFGDEASVDALELHEGRWISPPHAIARAANGEWTVAYPTLRHLERLAAFGSVDALFEHARARRPVAVMPLVAENGAVSLPPESVSW